MSTEVAAQVGRNIVTGNYQPGSLVEDESALARRFDVSRSVIRDAVKILVGKGLLDVRRGIGTRVRPRETWALLDIDVLAWQLEISTDNSLVFQMDEIRQLFEPQAAAWAACRARPSDIDEIDTALQSMQDRVADSTGFQVADARFHQAILKAARNDFLLALSGIIQSALASGIRLTNPDQASNERALPFHQAVFAAIRDQEPDAARRAMTSLVDEAGHCIRHLVGNVKPC